MDGSMLGAGGMAAGGEERAGYRELMTRAQILMNRISVGSIGQRIATCV